MKINAQNLALSVLVLLFLLCLSQNVSVSAAEDADDIEKKIEKYEDKAEATQKQLNSSQQQLQKNQVQVNSTKTVLEKTETEISRKEAEIKNLNDRITLNKKILESYLQEMYFSDQEDPVLKLAVHQNLNLNEVVENSDNLISVKQKVLDIMDEVLITKNQLDVVQKELAVKKEEHKEILKSQLGQQSEIKDDISEAQATLSELNSKINKLKSELSDLLGSAVSFKDVISAAEYASKKTGVRKDFILGMLVVESGLGKFTGGCTAEKSRMSSSRLTTFKKICKELGYDWKKKKVSCPPASYKGTGGAMGVAQFMPDTWMGYKSSISALTGHNPPDPWDLTDGVVGMALKLTKGGATKKSGECNAAKLYLSGTTNKKYQWYCDRVLYWAKNYEDKM
jgi:membrane-bound lytic murein transglycosylase B